jgi:hypothetical protein
MLKPIRILLSIGGVLAMACLTGCGNKTAPLKEGVLWSVRWAVPTTGSGTSTFGLYRTDKMDSRFGGTYGVDMYGVLYPTCLEIKYADTSNSNVQIIPLSQIVWLEFGDGGIRR